MFHTPTISKELLELGTLHLLWPDNQNIIHEYLPHLRWSAISLACRKGMCAAHASSRLLVCCAGNVMRATVCNRLPSAANTINSSFEYGYKAFPLSVCFLPGQLSACLYGQPL